MDGDDGMEVLGDVFSTVLTSGTVSVSAPSFSHSMFPFVGR